MPYITAFFMMLLALDAQPAAAQNPGAGFYEDLLVSDDLKLKETIEQAQSAAKDSLTEKARIKNLRAPKVRSQRQKEAESAAPQNEKSKLNRPDLVSAPFGLLWGVTAGDVEALGVTLTKIGEKDYVADYSATHLPKPVRDFRQIDLTFGIENELWRILAYGKFLNDDADASKVLAMYKKYYNLLNKKYGNGQEFFTPAVKYVTKTVTSQDGQPRQIEEKITEEMGNPDFLKQLQSGEAVLYATFEGHDVGAALAVNVDGDGKSYIVVDYKNLKILKQREEQTLDAL